MDQYPIPKIQDLFSVLVGKEKRLAKLDVSQTYSLMLASKSKQHLVTDMLENVIPV